MTEISKVGVLPKPATDRFRGKIRVETQIIQTGLEDLLGDNSANSSALADAIGFFTSLAPIRRTTFKNQSEALEVANGVYECHSQGKTLGIQGVLASSTALAELPHYIKIVELAKQVHIKPDLHMFYLDWDYYPSLRKREQTNDYPAFRARWDEIGLPPENLHNLSGNTKERKEFEEMFSGQAAMLNEARFPGHPFHRKYKKWIKHYKNQITSYYAQLAGQDHVMGLTSEFGNQIISDAANRRAICILAANQRRKMIGRGAWGYSLFVTTERSPVELAQYNTAISFIKTPGAKKDQARLPILNLDTST